MFLDGLNGLQWRSQQTSGLQLSPNWGVVGLELIDIFVVSDNQSSRYDHRETLGHGRTCFSYATTPRAGGEVQRRCIFAWLLNKIFNLGTVPQFCGAVPDAARNLQSIVKPTQLPGESEKVATSTEPIIHLLYRYFTKPIVFWNR